jgi:hypothetical protein
MNRMKQLRILIPLALWALISAGCNSGGSSSAVEPGGGGTVPEVVEFNELRLPPLAADGATYAIAVNDERAPRIVGIGINGAGVAKGAVWIVDGDEGALSRTLEALDDGKASAAYGVNLAGIVVGEAENGDSSRAVYWTAGSSTPQPLSMSGMLSEGRSAAFAISGDGLIVGEAEKNKGKFVPVLWTSTDADLLELPTLANTSGAAYFIHDGGWIVGEIGGKAVLWTLDATNVASAPFELPMIEGHERSIALGVESLGRIVGETEVDGAMHAVLWVQNGSGFQVIDLGPASAQAINDSGRIAGYTGGTSPASRAAIWTSPLFAPMDPAAILKNGVFSQAYGMNQASVVVGTKNHEAFVALPGVEGESR